MLDTIRITAAKIVPQTERVRYAPGLWHGASWNFILWGLYYGLFILIELLIGKKRMKKIPLFIRHIYNKIVIVVGFGIFYFEDFGQLGACLHTGQTDCSGELPVDFALFHSGQSGLA